VTGDPTFGEYLGYTTVDALLQGIAQSGGNDSQEDFITAMLTIRNYRAAGLYGDHSVGFGMDQRLANRGAEGCEWITQFSDKTFHSVPGEDPLCGSAIPGITVNNIR
jgi:branched-chain amino acid transport system substrate-binding protein